MLDYYLFSTDGSFVEGHLDHSFNGFIIEKIPLLKKTKIQSVASFHSMVTTDSDVYFEYGIGLEHIFKIIRVGYYQAFLSGKTYRNGVRIGLGF